MLSLIHALSRYSVWISGAFLLLSAVLVGIEVLMRNIFQSSFGGVDEISSYIFAIGVAWSLAFTLLSRAHIRIDLFYGRMTPTWRAALDVLSLACLLCVTGLLFQQALDTGSRNLCGPRGWVFSSSSKSTCSSALLISSSRETPGRSLRFPV